MAEAEFEQLFGQATAGDPRWGAARRRDQGLRVRS